MMTRTRRRTQVRLVRRDKRTYLRHNGAAPGSLTYTGVNIPATSSVTRDGENAVLPEGSAVYTNYFVLYSSGSFTATISGSNVQQLSISLTSDKKANDIPYEIVSSDDDKIVLNFSVTNAKTENVQLKLTNRSGSSVNVSELSLTRDNVVPVVMLPANSAA